jgi:hypothetical protein
MAQMTTIMSYLLVMAMFTLHQGQCRRLISYQGVLEAILEAVHQYHHLKHHDRSLVCHAHLAMAHDGNSPSKMSFILERGHLTMHRLPSK